MALPFSDPAVSPPPTCPADLYATPSRESGSRTAGVDEQPAGGGIVDRERDTARLIDPTGQEVLEGRQPNWWGWAPKVLPVTSDDPLLSVSQIARLWGTGLDVVTSLVDSDTLPSLDRGELIRQGHLDVPLIRGSWAEFMRSDSEGTGRILRPPDGESVHPAFHVALGVHSALDTHNADALWALSSGRSRGGHDPESLLARWTELNQGGYPTDSGVGSTIYSLAPLLAVAARVFANAPKLPRAVLKATPATLIAVLPLVWESGEWKVDLPLYAGDEGDAFLPELLTTPVPDGANLDPSQSDADDPPRSRPPKA